jgi:hypothetical protein
MKTSDAINKKVHELPEPLQREVLDFVEYLAGKQAKEDSDWSVFSLTSALRGLENETWPEYGEEDIKEKWQ